MLKKSLLSSAMLVGLLAQQASAADLFVPEVIIEPELLSWSGCYVGLDIQYDTGTSGSFFPYSDYRNEVTGPGLSPRAGCDIQLPDSVLVLGVVTDLTIKNQQDARVVVAGPPAQTLTTSFPWELGLRLRAGVAMDTTLFYLTGGLAVASVSQNLVIGGFDQTATNTHIGWSVGGGVEFMVTDNISVFAEYLYSDLGTKAYTFPGANFDGLGLDTLDFFAHNHAIKVGANLRF